MSDSSEKFGPFQQAPLSTVGVGHESTDSYTVFPSDPDRGPRATAVWGRAMARLSDEIREGGIEIAPERLIENAAARAHVVELDSLRCTLLRRRDDDIRVIHSRPDGSEDERRCVAELVTDVLDLASNLESPDPVVTACIRQGRACIVVADDGWVSFRAHKARETGLVLAAVHRFGHFTQSPAELHANGTNRA